MSIFVFPSNISLPELWVNSRTLPHALLQIWDGQSEGLTERINEPPWGRCLQGSVDVRWVVVVVVVVVASQGGVILD